MSNVVSIFRCANCGSRYVVPYSSGKKYKMAAFSLMRKNADEFKCPECGAILPYAMNDSDKSKADAMTVISAVNAHVR